MSYYLGIVGYRYYNNYEQFSQYIDQYIGINGRPLAIVSGGASGADHMAEVYANNNSIQIIVYLPQSSDRNGFLNRNTQIVDKSDRLFAFVSTKSRGTWDTIRKANNKGIPVNSVSID